MEKMLGLNNKKIEQINAYNLIEAPFMADKLKETDYDTFIKLLKQSELEIVSKINEIIDYLNNKEKTNERF